MKILRQVIVFDAADLAAESSFWAGMLGGRVVEDDDWHSVLDADGQWRIGVQLAPNHVPPEWPHGIPQQVRLDLHVDDPASAHDEVVALAAPLLQAADDFSAPRRAPGLCRPGGPPVLRRLGPLTDRTAHLAEPLACQRVRRPPSSRSTWSARSNATARCDTATRSCRRRRGCPQLQLGLHVERARQVVEHHQLRCVHQRSAVATRWRCPPDRRRPRGPMSVSVPSGISAMSVATAASSKARSGEVDGSTGPSATLSASESEISCGTWAGRPRSAAQERRTVVERPPVPRDLTRHLGLRGETQDGSQQGASCPSRSAGDHREAAAAHAERHVLHTRAAGGGHGGGAPRARRAARARADGRGPHATSLRAIGSSRSST